MPSHRNVYIPLRFASLLLLVGLVYPALPIPAGAVVPETASIAGQGRTGGLESISNSYVYLNTAISPDTCYGRGYPQTFCFQAISYTDDNDYVYYLWLRFPSDWVVQNVYVHGVPYCVQGGTFGPFSSYLAAPNELQITHVRYQANPADTCTAYYCVEVTSGSASPGVSYARVSWYWQSSTYGSPPFYPCSSDGYTPSGQPACDEMITVPAFIDPCILAVDDAYATTEDTVLSVPAPGVLGNDADSQGGPLTATLATPPLIGTAALRSDGSFFYTPTLNLYGLDSFIYTASNGSVGITATVHITVTAVNDAPLATDDVYSTTETTPLHTAAPGVLGNDVDPEGDPIAATLASSPFSGTVSLQADGAFVYTPTLGGTGVDAFAYIVSDGTLTGTANVLITVTPNRPPVAVDDTYTTTENTPLVVLAPGVLGNDSDPEGEPLLIAAQITPPLSGTLVLSADGAFVYVPAHGFSGIDTFTYAATDGALTDVATAAIAVMPAWRVYLPLALKAATP